jgi:hypothetical protein
MDGSVHNRTNLEKVTQAYFSQKKRARRWSREVVRRSVHRVSTQPHKICLGVDMDGSVHNRTRYVLGVDMEGSVHNRTNLEKVTQAYFSQKKRARRWSREVVRRSVHRFSVHNRTRYIWVQTWTVQYTTAQTLRKLPRFRRLVHR